MPPPEVQAVRSPARPGSGGRGADHDRFVAFAFAGANLLVETDPAGRIVYTAGSFRTEVGAPGESFVGQNLRALIAPADHETLDAAITLLAERGRLPPMMIRLANGMGTPRALAALVMPGGKGPQRLCFTLSPPPVAAGPALASARSLGRTIEARLNTGEPSRVGLIEVSGPSAVNGAVIGPVLQSLAPDALASEIGPGRFGVLGAEDGGEGLLDVADRLEKALKSQGMDVDVASGSLSLEMEGLSTAVAARLLRYALNAFARDGVSGLAAAGFDPSGEKGLAAYLETAGAQANALRRAIHAGHFDLVYQPVVGLQDNQVHHYEALIRPLRVPDCKAQTPQDFILMVEMLGLAQDVDIRVAEKACGAAQASGLAVAFNLSGISAQDPAFRDRLLALLQDHPAVRSGLISVELTETATLSDVAEAQHLVAALRGLGVPFCLDDFGAGAADLRMLRALEADIVKIDGSYVPGVSQPGRERAFVAGMVDIARAAGAAIVVEQIETEADAEVFRDLGVQYGQGWLFGRPGPLPDRTRNAKRRGMQESWS